MEKLIGSKSNIAVFISGRGTNLKSLIKKSRPKNSLFKIKLVISNNSKAKGLIYAKKNKIKSHVFEQKDLSSFENKVLKILKNSKIDMICLAGFMKILSKFFIKEFGNPILNIHPSLLPKYKGLNTHYRVLQNKEKYSGSTVHIVSPKLDSGKIILQKKVRISKFDTEKSLAKKVLKIEHKLYPSAIEKFLKNSNL